MNIGNKIMHNVISGSPGWIAEVVTMTPELAEEFMQGNYANRKIREGVVSRYKAAMADGSWVLAPEPIVIAVDGRVLNGQHRLSAVIGSGVSVPMLLIENVQDEVFRVIDRGISRTVADALEKEKKLVEVARLLASIVEGSHITLTDTVMLKVIGLVSTHHADLMVASNTHIKTFSSVPFRAAACVRLMYGQNRQYVLDTYRALTIGDVGAMSAIAQSAVTAQMRGKMESSGGGVRQIELLCRAWDIFDYRKRNAGRTVVASTDSRVAEIRDIVTLHMEDAE